MICLALHFYEYLNPSNYKKMKLSILLILCVISFSELKANDSLIVKLNQTNFQKGDTLSFDCNLSNYHSDGLSAVTMNVWVEDIYGNNRWKYRYPFINGELSGNLVIDRKLPDGKYAVNFIIEKQFCSIEGKIKDYYPLKKGVLCAMFTKDSERFFDTIRPAIDGSFKLPKLVFEDSCNLFFSPIGKKQNDLFIKLTTPLDSAFTPIAVNTLFVTVGNPNHLVQADTLRSYTFKKEKFERTTLPDVMVQTIKKKKVEMFDQEYSTGLFAGGMPTIYDGLESKQIANSIDLFHFLQGKFNGLKVDFNTYRFTYRGKTASIYLDEWKIQSNQLFAVNVEDIAMIKIFRPFEGGPSLKGGFSICIYTKKGNYMDNENRKYNFVVHGYTPLTTVWE